MKISYILPVYNVESFIERCLKSIYLQNLNLLDFEVIIINDCTKDNSMQIIRQWALNYHNIVIHEHLNNKGLGAARNTGINVATGDYIWFIDTDDYIQENCMSKLINLLELKNPEVLKFNFFKQNADSEFEIDKLNPSIEILEMTGESYLEYYFQPATMSSCSMIYSLSYWKENKFRFEEGVYWEDADLVVKTIYYSNKIIHINEYLYYYCYNQNSISRGVSGKKIADMIKMANRKLKFSNEVTNRNISQLIYEDALWNTNSVKKVLLMNNKERDSFYSGLSNIDIESLKNEIKCFICKLLISDSRFIRFFLAFSYPFVKLLKRLS